MKQIILSADDNAKLYLVPDPVAENLPKYCGEFSADWIWKNPNGKKLLKQFYDGTWYAQYRAEDFIDYLNDWIFPEQPSKLVKVFDCFPDELPEEYQGYPQYNF